MSMCFDICTSNIRVSIRVRGLHLVCLFLGWFGICLALFKTYLGFAEDLLKNLFEDFSGLVRSLYKFGLKCV